MCHAKIWDLDCGHSRVVHAFCPEAFADLRTGLTVPCGSVSKTYSDDANDPDAFCPLPLCRYRGRGWWCCRCRGRNLAAGTAYCLHRPAPVVSAGSRGDMPQEGDVCHHWRCGGCVDDRRHWFMMEYAELDNARKKQDEKNNSKGGEKKDDDKGKENEEDDKSHGWESIDDAAPGATSE